MVKNTLPELDSQHPFGSSQTSGTPVPEEPMPSSALRGHYMQIYIQANTNTHKIKRRKIHKEKKERKW